MPCLNGPEPDQPPPRSGSGGCLSRSSEDSTTVSTHRPTRAKRGNDPPVGGSRAAMPSCDWLAGAGGLRRPSRGCEDGSGRGAGWAQPESRLGAARYATGTGSAVPSSRSYSMRLT